VRLAGKRAIVTGAAANGIGRAITGAFRAEGASVVTIDKQPLPSDEAPLDGALHLLADVSDEERLLRCLRDADQHLGGADVLVNAAGMTHRKPFLELAAADWDEVHGVNLRPIFIATQWLARELVARQRPGSVINVASVTGSTAVAGQSHYCAAKSGVIMLSKAAATELAPHGVRVNTISPGCIETDFNRELLANREFREMRTAAIPLGRVGVPSEIAPVAVLLASDDGSFITGADYLVDGGQVAW
jgi:NAD(P)-dependent dehydrogenase (short-subunit alcohol dehydrogenase family)